MAYTVGTGAPNQRPNRRPLNLGQMGMTIGAAQPMPMQPTGPKPEPRPAGNLRAEALATALADGDLMRPTGSGTFAEALARGGEAFLRTRGATAAAEREESRYSRALAEMDQQTNYERSRDKVEDERDAATRAQQEQVISSLPPEQQALARLNPEGFVSGMMRHRFPAPTAAGRNAPRTNPPVPQGFELE